MSSPRFLTSCTIATLVYLTGCSIVPPTSSPDAPFPGISGRVHGGQQPVSGATIQLYTVGTAGDGSPATPLLSSTVKTDSSGNFNITGRYSCSGATLVYLTATGGNPGVSADNPNLALMTALGPCATLTSASFIAVNELSTVASVAALAPFMNSLTTVGSASADSAALTSGFALASQLVDPSTGTAPGLNPPGGAAVPVQQLNALADIIASCVNSTGGSANDGSTCGQLFALSTPAASIAPSNTVTALLNLARNPTLNVPALISLITPAAPFVPAPTSPPPDLSVRLALPPSQSISLSSSQLLFPATTVFAPSSALPITLTNTTSTPLQLSMVTATGPNAADFSILNSCPAILQPSVSCTAQVTFTPLATGTRYASLTIVSNAPASPQYVTFAAAGTPNAHSPANLYLTNLAFDGANLLGQIFAFPASSNLLAHPASTLNSPPGDYFSSLTGTPASLFVISSPAQASSTTSNTSVIALTPLPSGALTESRRFSANPAEIAADATGRVYAASADAREVSVYNSTAAGSVPPLFTLTNQTNPLSTDLSGLLYATSLPNISLFSAGLNAVSAPLRTFQPGAIDLAHGDLLEEITTDTAGNVYVLAQLNSTSGPAILVYPPNSSGLTAPSRIIAGPATQLSVPGAFTVDANGTLYVADYNSAFNAGVILEFAPNANGNATPATTILLPEVYYVLSGSGMAVH